VRSKPEEAVLAACKVRPGNGPDGNDSTCYAVGQCGGGNVCISWAAS
jgi:hypothetical protein